MALPNLVGLLLLSGEVVREARAYRGGRPSAMDPNPGSEDRAKPSPFDELIHTFIPDATEDSRRRSLGYPLAVAYLLVTNWRPFKPCRSR